MGRGQIPLDQTLRCAVQIAEALDAAHRHGVVHRDLKPGNVMLARSGVAKQRTPQVKLLDFGLAKHGVPESALAGATFAATQSLPLTGTGEILGTLQYMAPEQLEG
jgi:serine/threonine protein kinase